MGKTTEKQREMYTIAFGPGKLEQYEDCHSQCFSTISFVEISLDTILLLVLPFDDAGIGWRRVWFGLSGVGWTVIKLSHS
jgi:hypothetical protein